MWECRISHDGLHKFRVVHGTTKEEAEFKAMLQEQAWEEQWQRKLEQEKRRKEKEKKMYMVSQREKEALKRTSQINETLENVENLLRKPLELEKNAIWSYLKDKSSFGERSPKAPTIKELERPDKKHFAPSFNLVDHIFKSSKEKKIKDSDDKFKKTLSAYNVKLGQYKKAQEQFRNDVQEWEIRKNKFYENKETRNNSLDEIKKRYFQKERDAMIKYYEMLLMKSEYPDSFPQEVNLDFNTENSILVLDYQLPAPSQLPNLREVKYIRSKNELKEVPLPESKQRKMYDTCLYQIALRTIYELFKHDYAEVLKSIVFNGWVKSIDKGTGQEINPCVLSIQANREEFMPINVKLVDPRECFKKLKGVGSSKLHALAPIPPIITLNKDDKRFIESRNVAEGMGSGQNIAAMHWDDFEHLIRELFEKEFTQSGGEVKVTQASRDGGVDAIAFDPDPIRGGKIVIQAKRYTNVVGVDAVRDLYGTVINEGATKGILITTSEYGPDAYKFAKGKPLTLLTGGHLLHMLEKHGHKAKIDLKEAKEIIKEEKEKR